MLHPPDLAPFLPEAMANPRSLGGGRRKDNGDGTRVAQGDQDTTELRAYLRGGHDNGNGQTDSLTRHIRPRLWLTAAPACGHRKFGVWDYLKYRLIKGSDVNDKVLKPPRDSCGRRLAFCQGDFINGLLREPAG